jgi:cobalamin-dependent methionine synthase I
VIIIGEKINTSRKSIALAVERKDRRFIQSVARSQAEAGADYIDVNAGTFLEKEVEYLPWLVEVVQSEVDRPLCLDSPNPKALEKALEVHRGQAMINSISLEKERYEALLPVIASRPCKVVALCMARTAMPTTVQERIDAAAELIDGLTRAGVDPRHIFVDPLVQPVSVDVRMGPVVLESISRIMSRFSGVRTICGLSNISFGLPLRRQINRHFLVLAMARGLSAAILDPTDPELMTSLITAQMLLGQDEYCSAFIEAYERGITAQEP